MSEGITLVDMDGNPVFVPSLLPTSERVYGQSEIKRVLVRLVHYYDGRAKSALKAARKSIDAQSALSQVQCAVNWESRHDAVMRVAENLEIAMEEK